ncbi:12116_t:CDS:2 [Funneliformis caledonium]|uniref:12116_t:CDS:1 n=1 Tax=Funneliformis caledonium TaxID=1117310 RepID=A0A9N9FFI8_9GLOM|nr:12116_t:CDS:2 [Funneliformis caledonium]
MPIAYRLRSSKKNFDNNIQSGTTPEQQLSTPSNKPSKSKAKKNVNSSKNSKPKSSVVKGSKKTETKDDTDTEHSSAADQNIQIPENSKITPGIDEIVSLSKDSSIETLKPNDIDKSKSIETNSQNQCINDTAEESQPINETEDKNESATLEKNETNDNELRDPVDNIAENIQGNLETSEAQVDSKKSVPSETNNVVEQTTSQTDSGDEAPETISMSTSRIQALDIKKKEREVQQKSLEIKKRKRREIDAKLKEQKSRKAAKLEKSTDPRDSKEEIDIIKKINEEGLPRFLPTELLKDLPNDDKVKKKRKQPEEPMQIKSKMSKTELQSKKEKSRKQPNTGPFTVVALQDPNFDKSTPIAKGVAEFKEDHFYGERLPRKNGKITRT